MRLCWNLSSGHKIFLLVKQEFSTFAANHPSGVGWLVRFPLILLSGRKKVDKVGYREDWFANNESNHGWYTCAKCGKKIHKADVDIDHILPQKHHGPDELWNLQCLCKHCNRSKQASLKDTVPDIAKTNKKRAVKAVKKNLKFTGEKIAGVVKKVVTGKKK